MNEMWIWNFDGLILMGEAK